MISPNRRDYSTRVSLNAVQIRKIAENVRAFLEPALRADFNVVAAMRRLAAEACFAWGKLEIKFFSASDGESLAYVNIGKNGKTLHVDRDIWAEAELGEPHARYILAHELGHLVLHDCYVQPFSNLTTSIFDQETSTEWQAHTFAECFLILERDIEEYVSPRWITSACLVEESVVKRRLGARLSYVGEFCCNCGSATVYRTGRRKRCNTCGETGED